MSNHPVVIATGSQRGGGDLKPVIDGDSSAADPAPSRGGLWQFGIRSLPWLLALALAVAVLVHAGVPALEVARYAAYWCLGVTLPGLLVARATVGTRGNWPEDLAIGAVTGLGLELACFTLWSVLGLQQQLWLWPVLVVTVFVAMPRLRRHWRIRLPQPLPTLWSWGVASSIAAGILNVGQSAFSAPLPPAGGVYYPDTPWHLSIVQELARAFPPQVPQVSGQALQYHWFSHAHLAAASLVSGVPVPTVVLRLWILPLLAVTALIGAALARELSGRWWSGPVAAWGLVVFAGTSLLPVLGEAGAIFPTSPSEVYALPLFLGCVILIVQALRGIGLGAGWVVLALLLVVAAGAKPTTMPLVLAGTLLAGLVLRVRRSRQWLAALSVAAMVTVILPASLLAVAGSDGGATAISLFDFAEWQPIYHSLTGAGFNPAAGPMLPEGVSDLSARSLAILVILLLVPLVANIGRLAPFGWLGSRRLRGDPAAWFMAGVVIAGWVVYLTLSHPAYSQAYFLRLANPIATVFGAWALAAAVPPAVRAGRRVVAVLAAGTLFGAGVVAAGRAVTPTLTGRTGSLSAVAVSFLVPLAVLIAAIGAGVLSWGLARRRVPGLRGWGSALVLAALVLGGPAEGAINPTLDPIVDVAFKPVPSGAEMPPHPMGFPISADEAAAMAWISQHTGSDAVVATNRHCVSGPERPRCQSMAFWVSGLGGRRTVLEGWGYTSQAKTASSPTPFPERRAVNDAAFTEPSATTIDRLRLLYGARWLVADTSAGPVSGELARYAAPRFHRGKVTVYELRPGR